MIDVYSVNIDSIALYWEYLIELVTCNRRAKALSYKKNGDRLRSLATGLLMRTYLGVTEDKNIIYNKYGKPFIKGGPAFSISHSGHYTVLGVGDGNSVGIDIEMVKDVYCDIIDDIFTYSEKQWQRMHTPYRFYILWTRKESILKAIGKGLSINPNTFSVVPIENKYYRLWNRDIFVSSRMYNNHALSVAAIDEECEYRIRDISIKDLS